MPKPTAEQIAKAQAVYADTGSYSDASEASGLSWHTVKRYVGGNVPPEAEDEPEAPPDPIQEEQERQARLRELRRERDLLTSVAGERSFRSFLSNLVETVAPRFAAVPAYVPAAPHKHATVETLLLMLSDFHAYETVKSDRVLGLNSYDAPTMARRAKRVIDSALSIKERMERGGGWRFPKCVVAANGDFVSGTIHEVERHSDAPNVVMAVFGAGMTLASMVRDLASRFESVEVFCTSGNHGRLPDARRMQQKDPTRNWDTLIYLFARTALRDIANVRFHIPDSYSVLYELEGFRFYQGHGHDIKSWNSIPFYGINRMASNLNALLASKDSAVHYWLFSHFHNKASMGAAGGEYFINGSLIGGTEFSVNGLGRSDDPCQLMLGVHPRHGVTHRWPIQAEDPDHSASYEAYPWVAEDQAA